MTRLGRLPKISIPAALARARQRNFMAMPPSMHASELPTVEVPI